MPKIRKRVLPLPDNNTKPEVLYEQLELVKSDIANRNKVKEFNEKSTVIANKKSTKKFTKKNEIAHYINDARIRSRSGDWEGSTGRVFLGLYALCYEMIYGVESTEFTEKSFVNFCSKLATKILVECFDGDCDEMVEFIKWSWEEQKKKRTWAIRKGLSLKKFSCRYQFSKSAVDEYLINRDL